MFWWMSRTAPDVAPPQPTPATEVAVGTNNRPLPQPIDLPGLAESDSLLRNLVSALSAHPLLARLLATDSLVRGATLAVVQIGDGKTPASPLAVLRPMARLQLRGGQAQGPIEPASYARWDTAVTALQSIDPRDAAQLYVNVKPLFDEAYKELGSPAGGDFDQAVIQAYHVLAATPDLPSDPALVRRPGYYEYDDPALRALRPVQKQFLLMGPEHRKAVLDWLRQLATALDLQL
ncbi:MAG: DUF3014 domain-containing protein [Vicinamibacterales bacterium]